MQVGDDIVLRYITRDGRPGFSWAARVVEDSDALLALSVPKDTPHKRWTAGPSGRVLTDGSWWSETLRLMFPDRWHSVWLRWDDDGSFRDYYVNFEEPFRRTAIGVDTNDHQLDIVVAPDLSWIWKDEDIVRDRQRTGDFSDDLVRRIYEEAHDVIRTIETRAFPFDGTWRDWRRDASRGMPVLHPRWNAEPPAHWDRREWAYPKAALRTASESG